jgi:hypothetical protein
MASLLGARLLKGDAEVLCDFDTDLLYGFNTRVTEETLGNFIKFMHLQAESDQSAMYDLLLHPYDEKMHERAEQVTKIWRNSEKDVRTGWRLSAQLELSESDDERRLRQSEELVIDSMEKTSINIEKRFDQCVCADCPHLVFEYEKRVRDLQADVQAPFYIDYNTETKRYTRKTTDGEDNAWLFEASPSALVDNGLMIEFYADMERRDLVMNMHTCKYFSADEPYTPDVQLHEMRDIVNPWTWMYRWLQGDIDGVRWADLGRDGDGDEILNQRQKKTQYQKNMNRLYTRRNRGQG